MISLSLSHSLNYNPCKIKFSSQFEFSLSFVYIKSSVSLALDERERENINCFQTPVNLCNSADPVCSVARYSDPYHLAVALGVSAFFLFYLLT